jgi:hypothetical protein
VTDQRDRESWEEKGRRKRGRKQGRGKERSKREEGCNALEYQAKGKTGKQFVVTAHGMATANSS